MSNANLRTSKLGLELIKYFEGCRLTAYKCPANVLTIGIGHTGKVDGKPIFVGQKITQQKAEQLLATDLIAFELSIKRAVKVPLKQHQFDALVSFSFNVGIGAFQNSTLLRLLNQGEYNEVPLQLKRWNKANGKPLAGLTRRRAAEGYLWQTAKLKFNF